MAEGKPTWTPMAHNSKLTAEDPGDNTTVHQMDINGFDMSYLGLVGSLMYVMFGNSTGPCIPVVVLGQYSASPKKCHWEAAKHALYTQ
jgi:hypothetical protein